MNKLAMLTPHSIAYLVVAKRADSALGAKAFEKVDAVHGGSWVHQPRTNLCSGACACTCELVDEAWANRTSASCTPIAIPRKQHYHHHPALTGRDAAGRHTVCSV